MFTSKKVLAAGIAAAALATAGAAASSAVHADPAQLNAFAGVGSDTVQDVTDAFMGRANNIDYTPLHASNGQQLISFTATVPSGAADTCITTKLNGGTFTRPNGSGAGIKALSQAAGHGAAGWTGSAIGSLPVCASLVDTSGSIDFARSSSGPSGSANNGLTWVPFARDGVSFAYYRKGGSPVTSLTKDQLTSLFTTGAQNIGGVNFVPCGIQTSSGTYKFWNSVTDATAAQEAAAVASCPTRLEENDANGLKTAGDSLADGTEVVVGFSAAAFTAKSNGVAYNSPTGLTMPSEVGIGSISDNGTGVNLGSPVSGTAPNITPNSAFFNDAKFGRYVYFVLPTSVATGAGNAAIKSMFVGGSSAVCSATSTINKFGFLTTSNCGITTLTGDWVSGAS